MVSTRTRHAQSLFAGLPRTYDRMGALLSFGQDPRWRRFLVSQIPEGSRRTVDVATGTGAVAIELVRQGRSSFVTAFDQSMPMLRQGMGRAAGEPIRFVVARAESPPFAPETFDALTVTYLLRYVDDPAATLRELARLVRPGGMFASLEFGVPTHTVWRACWRLYTRAIMPGVGMLVSRDWHRVGRFLGPSIEGFWRSHPLEEQLRMWRDAGLDGVRWRRMSLGGGVVMWGVKR